MSNKKSEEIIIKAFQKYMENGKSVLPTYQQGGFNYFKATGLGQNIPENIGYTPNTQNNNWGFGNGEGYAPKDYSREFDNNNQLPDNIIDPKIGYAPKDYLDPNLSIANTEKEAYNNWKKDNINNLSGEINNAAALNYGLYEFGQGNNLGGTLGVAKGVLGTLREGMSAYSTGKANKYAKDQYQDKQYGVNNNVYERRQEGGYVEVDNSDLPQIQKDSGISFTLEGAQQLFGKSLPSNGNVVSQKIVKHQPGVTDGKTGIDGERIYYKYPPTGPQDYKNVTSTDMMGVRRSNEWKNYLASNNKYQEGGETGQENPQAAQQQQVMQQVAQMLQQGTAPEIVVQKLVEMGMPQEQAQQILQQVVQTIQAEQAPQEQVMQQGGKVGKEITGSEALTGEYTTEVSPNEEKTVNIEKNEWIKNNETGEITKAIGNTHKNGGMDVNLKDAKIISNFTKIGGENAKFFSKTFDLKLGATDTFAKVIDSYTKKSGLSKLTEEEVKLTDKMGDILTKNNPDLNSQELNAKFLTGKMQEVLAKKEPLKEKRDAIFEEVFKRQEAIPKRGKPGELIMKEGGEIDPILQKLALEYGITPERANELTQTMQQGGTIDKNDKLTQAQQKERLKYIIEDAKRRGYDGDADYKAKDLNKEAAKIQNWQAESNPQVVQDYYTKSGQPLNAKHIDMLKERFPETFKESGINPNKPSASYTEDEKSKLQTQAGNNIDQNFLTEGFKDGLFDWRGVLQTSSELKPVGIQKQSISATGIPNYYQPTEAVIEDPVAAIAKEQEKVKRPSGGGDMHDFGFQPIYIPPSAIQPVYKANSTAPDVEWIKMTAEPNLVEAERQRAAAQGRYQGLSPEVAAAMAAQDFAQTQMATNTAISNAEAVNQQAENAGRAQQAAYDFKSDMVNDNYANQYEQKVFGGQNSYEAALQNFYNKSHNEPGQIAELNKNKAAAYNSMNENYKIGRGNVEFNATDFNFMSKQPEATQLSYQNGTPEERKKMLEDLRFAEAKKKATK